MKTKFKGILTLLLAFVVQISFAQEKTVSGTVSDDSGVLAGVSISIKGTVKGTETDFDGKYSISTKDGDVLVFRYLGYQAKEVTVGSSNTINVTLSEDNNVLDEIVITGVAGPTSKKKLAISAATVGADLLENVPATSAGAAIQGKVAGVTVVQPSGLPGSSPAITIRGATSLLGNQAPLIIVDGVFLASGNLADINTEDIKSFEILKGAAAASLYGSKAANGVIQIITKRGKGATAPQVTIRAEAGMNSILRGFEVSNFHFYQLDGSGQFIRDANGGLVVDAVGGINNAAVIDNPFPDNFNNFDQVYGSGLFTTQSASVAGGADNVNYYISVQNQENQGIIKVGNLKYKRKSGKVNLDFQINDKLSISTSNTFSRADSREPNVGSGGPLYTLQFTPPHINLLANNEEDGSPYDWDAFSTAGWPTAETNPLYYINNYNYNEVRERLITNVSLKYKANDWLTFNGSYGQDNLNFRANTFVDKDWLDDQQTGFINGQISNNWSNFRNENLQLDVTTRNSFGELDLTTRLQALQENQIFERQNITGSELVNLGVNNIENVTQSNLNAGGFKSQEVAQSYSGILNLIYKDRYIFDGLYRYEQVSTYGPLARNQSFFRTAAAYRAGMDLELDWINELKFRASYGTSGLRPPNAAQFEVVDVSNGNNSKNTLGSPNLGASVSKEIEAGFDFDFLDRFRTTFTYSNTQNENLVISVPLPAAAGGFTSQWVNAASIESDVIEATFGVDIIKNDNINWNFNALFTKFKAKITEFNRSDQQVGPSSAFLLKAGEDYGSFYGNSFMTSLSQLPAGTDTSLYSIYKGLVVLNSTNEAQIAVDENGTQIIDKIGNTTPDFNMSFNTSFSYKDFTLYALLDWQKGGDVYNQTKQWRFRELIDPSIVGETVGYASSVYAVNQINTFFVEDASFIKLRELSLNYKLPSKYLENTGIKGISLGVVGRNLFIISDYSGVDPEVSDITSGGDLTNYRFDAFGYPSVSTFSGTLTIKF